ncbi:MAG: hypothetical protein HYV40_06845 [Candidatus Levybacteria bacterium]|nr:hypothetical protein [Candidatus Levybacteria bacterium]
MKAAFFVLILTLVFVIVSLSFSQASFANNSWNNYHWARTSNPFTLKLGDNLSGTWDPYLVTTSSDWSQSTVLDTTIVSGTQNPRRCRPTSGRVEVCSYRYGNNGWLGMAQIWISGSHITKGVMKVNDTYFNTAKYNTSSWRNIVMCQEVGHTLGLDHQDENFTNPNLGTCMDYTDNPSGPLSNEHPNQHDYDMLGSIYAHLDGFTSVQSGTQQFPFGRSLAALVKEIDFESRSEWGKELRNNGRVALFERDFGGNNKVFTFVIWAHE